jgi:hypothetical protein
MADDPNANPAAELYQLDLAVAAADTAPVAPVLGDGEMWVHGTLTGGLFGGTAPATSGPAVAIAGASEPLAFDASGLIKIVVIVALAAMIGSALFSGGK